MNPAHAMGTFLRTWRAEWAGVSRPQLALAVSSLCPKQKAVTPEIIRAWESGQPPKSSDELEALLQVMRRHGLWTRDVERFRTAAFAACAGRQYPELLDGESFAHREDVENLAQVAFDACHVAGRRTSPPATDDASADLVALVAWTTEVESAVYGGSRSKVTRPQLRRQQAALAYLRAALAQRLEGYKWSMFDTMARMRSESAAFLQAHFGAGHLGGRLSVTGERIAEAWTYAHHARSLPWCRRLLELSESAKSSGQHPEAAEAFLRAMHCLGELQQGVHEALRSAAREHVELANSMTQDGLPDAFAYLGLIWAAMGDGALGDAESWLSELEGYWPVRLTDPCWAEVRVWIALERGDFGAAQAHHKEGRYQEELVPGHCAAGEALERLIEPGLSRRGAKRGVPVRYAHQLRAGDQERASRTARRMRALPRQGRPPP